MPILIIVLFLAFIGCVLGQFYLVRQVRRALADRHPETWRAISDKALFIDNALISFVLKGRDKALHDIELSRLTNRMRQLQVLTIAIWLLYAVMLFSGIGVHKSTGG